MSRVTFTFACVIFVAGTLGSGWVHGIFINRWGRSDELGIATAKLGRELPAVLGPWRLVKAHEVEPGIKEALGAAAILSGLYINDQTGDHVIVALLAGPSGPLSVHTPEICYAASDYELAGERQTWTVRDRREERHSLWEVHANARHATQPNLRVLYGWSRGGSWEAMRGPRFALAGMPVVYKLQVAGPARDRNSTDTFDPCEDFLSRFLADIQPRIIPTTARSATST
jgi:hypothetical protein